MSVPGTDGSDIGELVGAIVEAVPVSGAPVITVVDVGSLGNGVGNDVGDGVGDGVSVGSNDVELLGTVVILQLPVSCTGAGVGLVGAALDEGARESDGEPLGVVVVPSASAAVGSIVIDVVAFAGVGSPDGTSDALSFGVGPGVGHSVSGAFPGIQSYDRSNPSTIPEQEYANSLADPGGQILHSSQHPTISPIFLLSSMRRRHRASPSSAVPLSKHPISVGSVSASTMHFVSAPSSLHSSSTTGSFTTGDRVGASVGPSVKAVVGQSQSCSMPLTPRMSPHLYS